MHSGSIPIAFLHEAQAISRTRRTPSIAVVIQLSAEKVAADTKRAVPESEPLTNRDDLAAASRELLILTC
jgi:hypothetical protein